jgi:hypothetical protein
VLLKVCITKGPKSGRNFDVLVFASGQPPRASVDLTLSLPWLFGFTAAWLLAIFRPCFKNEEKFLSSEAAGGPDCFKVKHKTFVYCLCMCLLSLFM